jgi:hypothetical protein
MSDPNHSLPDVVMVSERTDFRPDPDPDRVSSRKMFTSQTTSTTNKTMSVPLIINTEFIDNELESSVDQTVDKNESEDMSLSEGSLRSRYQFFTIK